MAKKIEENEGRTPDGKFAVGNKFSPGSTPFYSDPEELAVKLLEYFEWIKGEYEIHDMVTTNTKGSGKEAVTTTIVTPTKIWIRDPEDPTMTGLALFLGFESRQSLYDYGKKDGFSYPIKKALLEVENNYEKGLWSDKVAGVVFALKNMGWADKTETKLTGDADNPIEIKEQTKIIFSRGFGDSR